MTDQTPTDFETAYASALARDAERVRSRFAKAMESKATPQPPKPCGRCGTIMQSASDTPICLPCRQSPAYIADRKRAKAAQADRDAKALRRKIMFAAIHDGGV